jgi:hypothetical protein
MDDLPRPRSRAARMLGLRPAELPPGDPLRNSPEPAPPDPPEPAPPAGHVPAGPRQPAPGGDFLALLRGSRRYH